MLNDTARRVILIVKDAGNARVLEQAVAEIGMVGHAASSETELKNELDNDNAARVALVDVTGFGRTVWNLCDLLQQYDVAFVVLSTSKDRHLGNQTLEYGASSVLQKPVAKRALLQLIQDLYGEVEA